MGMFGNTFGGWHLLVILFLVLLLFGAPKLPALAKSVAQSMKIFRSEVKTDKTTDAAEVDPSVPQNATDHEANAHLRDEAKPSAPGTDNSAKP
ncbi:hypothetical protein GCM10027416_21280 [Okibacterium endophyticum]